MRLIKTTVLAAGLLALSACGGDGDDALGEQAQESAEAKADAMENAADRMSGPAEDAMEARADAVREGGEAREEAIDDADVRAGSMSQADKDALVKGQ